MPETTRATLGTTGGVLGMTRDVSCDKRCNRDDESPTRDVRGMPRTTRISTFEKSTVVVQTLGTINQKGILIDQPLALLLL